MTSEDFCEFFARHSGCSDRELLYIVLRNQEEIMAAIDTLTANVAKLATDVDLLLAKPAGVPEAQVQAVADIVGAIDAKVVAALPPTP